MSWFPDRASLQSWSGPNFRYPFTQLSFKQDLKLDTLHSKALLGAAEHLLAFGQFYQRLGRCHLGRLVVNPDNRGQGLIGELIEQLIAIGVPALNADSSSLFVLKDNQSALLAYRKSGFVEHVYPEPMELDNCLYMVRPVLMG